MKTHRRLAAAGAAVAVSLTLAACSPVAATAPASPVPTAIADTPTPTPTPTVSWQDPQPMIMLPDATTPAHLPHGPSWATQDGTMKCGIYDDWDVYVPSKGTTEPGVYYGCRIEPGANRFVYPKVDDNPGDIGGCPSGFAAAAGQAVVALCNSGQVFSSETGRPTVLLPGEGVRFAGIECIALAVGMSCTETATGHGFRVTLDDFSLS